MPNYQGVWNITTQFQYAAEWPVPFPSGDLGLFTSAYTTNVLDFVTVSSTGNAADFGDATAAKYYTQGHGNATRGITGYGGAEGPRTIDYVEFATKGNAADFGDTATQFGSQQGGGCGSNARGVFASSASSLTNIMEYVTMANLGNGTDFGDLTQARGRLTATSSATRGIFAGGYTDSVSFVDTIDYITIANTGNASDFGNLTLARTFVAGAASATRGLIGGGYNDSGGGNYQNIIDYVTIGSTGNASDFGDLSVSRASLAGTSNTTRAIFGGGDSGSAVNVIDYVTIGSTGNASDFGDLTVVKRWGDAVGSATAAGAA